MIYSVPFLYYFRLKSATISPITIAITIKSPITRKIDIAIEKPPCLIHYTFRILYSASACKQYLHDCFCRCVNSNIQVVQTSMVFGNDK